MDPDNTKTYCNIKQQQENIKKYRDMSSSDTYSLQRKYSKSGYCCQNKAKTNFRPVCFEKAIYKQSNSGNQFNYDNKISNTTKRFPRKMIIRGCYDIIDNLNGRSPASKSARSTIRSGQIDKDGKNSHLLNSRYGMFDMHRHLCTDSKRYHRSHQLTDIDTSISSNKPDIITRINSTSLMKCASASSGTSTDLTKNQHRILLTITIISICLMLTLIPGSDAVDCFKCSSRNGSNPACEDPFHNTNSTRVTTTMLPNPAPNVAYHTPCYAGKKSRDGLFLASACIKLTGTFDTTGETMVVRHCALDSGTLTPDTELARMSHCGRFQFEGDYLRGCVLACPEDACNSAWSIRGIEKLKTISDLSIHAIWNMIVISLVPVITTKYLLF